MGNVFSRKRINYNQLDQANNFHGHGEAEDNILVQETSGKEEKSINRRSNNASHGAVAYAGNALYAGGDIHGNLVGGDKKELHFHIGARRTDKTKNRSVKKIALKKFKVLKNFLTQEAKENSSLEDTTFFQKSGRCPGYAPLQMAQQKDNPDEDGHLHTREEMISSYNNSSAGYLQPEEFFEKAKKLVCDSAEYKNALTQKAELKCLSKLANVIGVIGQAGVGKSTLIRILLSQIVSKERLYKADYIFCIKLRDFYNKTEMNLFQFLMGEEACSSLDWMNDEEIRNEVLKLLFESESVCILLDGLDEIGITIPESEKVKIPSQKTLDSEKFKVKVFENQLPQNFILGLLKGEILPGAKKILTSRPGQMLGLPDQFRPKFLVQILGITPDGINKICKNLCGDKSSQVLAHVKSQPDLHSYITIPIHCVLVINCIYDISTNQVDKALPNSITDVFILSYFDFAKTEHMREDLNQFDIKNISDLQKICSLAWSGIKKKEFYFSDDDLKTFSLNQPNISSFTVTVESRMQKRSKASYIHRATPKCTYFTHLLIQEFFAAIHCLFFMNEETFEETFSFVSGESAGILSNHYLMVVKFMFGLSNAETFKMFQSVYPYIDEPRNRQNLLKQYASMSMSTDYFFSSKNIFVCSLAYELRNESFAKKIVNLFPDQMTVQDNFLSADVLPFCYVLQYRNNSLKLSMKLQIPWKCS